MSRELCGICMCPLDETGCGCDPETYDAYGVNTQNTFNTPPQEIPRTYEEYMASGLFSKEWEAGFIAGKMHELGSQIEQEMRKIK